jgi:hypothetical protein
MPKVATYPELTPIDPPGAAACPPSGSMTCAGGGTNGGQLLNTTGAPAEVESSPAKRSWKWR